MTSIADGPITPFLSADFANPFNTYTATRPGILFQTSHKWSGSDNVPKAGALPPVGAYPAELLNKSTGGYADLTGTLSCSRCHDIHNTLGNTFVTRANHFLRADNTNDAMCRDCHRMRDNANTLSGSHPVNISYNAAKNPQNLNVTPISSNPANYTATLSLINGKVQCSTCHAAHFADSNSSTFDNRSSAIMGQLSTSKGYLLRTGMRGASPNATNICTNCHANKFAHNGAGQNVQCADCHGGHVDQADGTQPNVFVVNRYMNISTIYGAVRNKTVLLQYTGASRNYKDAQGKGVCQACHAVPASGTAANGKVYPAAHDATDAKTCNGCHFHASSAGSFSGGCSSCHGFPPQTNTVGGSTGKASVAYGVDESTTRHKQHYVAGYTCKECHFDENSATLPPIHKNGSFQDVFNPAYVAPKHGLAPVYSAGTRTCSSVYCHSNGAPAGGTAFKTYTTPNWVGGTVTCSSCHEASPTTNVHQSHLTKGYACDTCHSATVTGSSTIKDATKHANDQKDVLFSSSTLSTAGWTYSGAPGRTCSTVYCHSNGKAVFTTPTWTTTATANCGVCHGSTGIASGAHQKHLTLTATYGPKLNSAAAPVSCNNCHNYPNGHIDGSVQTPSTCAVLCHPNGMGTALWTNTARITDCTLCHTTNASYMNGKYAPDKSLFAASKHGLSYTCATCHNANSDHISVTGGTKRLTDTSGTVSVCNSCHDTAAVPVADRNMPTHFTVKGGAPNMLCKECHDPHGSANLSFIKASISYRSMTAFAIDYTDRASKWVNTTTNRGLCQVCHTNTNHYRAGVADLSGHPTTNCYNCHDHKNTDGAFKPKGNCDSCHGYPPVPRNVVASFGTMNNWSSAKLENYSGGGGAHLVAGHIPQSAKASEGWSNCAVCHNGGVTASSPYHLMSTPVQTHISSVTVKVDPRFKFNATKYISYSGAKLVNPPAVNNSGRCFNVSCHFAPTPRWSTEK